MIFFINILLLSFLSANQCLELYESKIKKAELIYNERNHLEALKILIKQTAGKDYSRIDIVNPFGSKRIENAFVARYLFELAANGKQMDVYISRQGYEQIRYLIDYLNSFEGVNFYISPQSHTFQLNKYIEPGTALIPHYKRNKLQTSPPNPLLTESIIRYMDRSTRLLINRKGIDAKDPLRLNNFVEYAKQ